MSNPYYNHGSAPSTGSPGASSTMRAEFDLIAAGFNLLPVLSGNGGKVVVVNGGGTALTVTTGTLTLAGDLATVGAYALTLTLTGATSLTLPTTGTLATLAGSENFTNKTLTAPVLSGTITGTYTLAGTPTLTSPTINTPTIANPVFSGSATGSLTALALTSAVLTTSTVAADPTTSLGIASKQYVDTNRFTTGDVKLTLKTAADTGWVLMNDGTIGNAASGGTTRANADTSALFTLLWNNTVDADCAVSGGRGASAAADYAANKTIALPKALGRALAVYGSGSGLTARALAKALGSEDAVVVQHNHGITDPGHAHTVQGTQGGTVGGIIYINAGTITGTPSTDSAQTGISINNQGVSGTGVNMPPTVFLNVMIKL